MDQSKIANLNPQEYTHLPHADQHFEDHEQTDVAVRPLAWTLVAIAVVIVVTMVGMWGFFELLEHWQENATENQARSAIDPKKVPIRMVPDGYPALQGVPAERANANSPAQDTEEMRKENAEILAGHKPMRKGLKPGKSIESAMDEALSNKIFKTAAPGGAGEPTTRQASR